MITVEELKRLKEKSFNIMIDVLEMTTAANSGHPGGSLSSKDIVTVLFFHVMRHNPGRPDWPDRDRLILSKGHAAPALYSALAEAGYIDRQKLGGFRSTGSQLQGHPERNPELMIEASTGSLGNGLAMGNGIALAGKLDGRSYRVYVLMGDGELQEGTVWEAAMFAPYHRLNNIIAIVDRNGLQQNGPTESTLSIEPLDDKWKSFGWNVIDVDGHDIPELIDAFEMAKRIKDRPTAIIAHTVKGRGVMSGEWVVDFHSRPMSEESLKNILPGLYEQHRLEMEAL